MSTPEFFTVTADYKSVIADSPLDSDYLGELGPISATVTFTPLLQSGDILLATTATPRPTGYVPVPVVGRIDVETGRLMLRVDPDDGGTGTFSPITLMANTELLEIDGPLYYRVTFSEVVIGGRPGYLAPFDFEAPTTGGAEVNLIEVAPVPGSIANGIVKVSPGGVRQIDGTTIAFTFGGVDLQPTVSLAALSGPTGATGATGATGSAATIAVGSVTSLPPGSTATVVNEGSSGAAVFSFGLVTGATGSTGATGAQGIQGEQGVQGIQGVQGEAGISLDINGTIATYGDLPGAPEPGDAYIVAADGKLYFFDGASWPADGDGVPFVGPQGPQGIQGVQGLVGPTGAVGQAATIAVGTVTSGETASVTNTGDSTDAVFDIVLPIGPTGATGAVGPTGDAATIAIDSTVTGDPGTDALVENLGDANNALIRVTVPRGDTGPVGATGATGAAGQAANLRGSVADYASLPTTGLADGDAYVAEDTGLLFVFDGTSFPAEGDGVPFVGPRGDTGPTGPAGADGADGSDGAVGPTGPAGADGADGSDGATGATGPQGEPGTTTWAGITDKPAVIAAGVDAAAARSVISAEYTGNKSQPGGYAALDASGLVPASQLPSFVEDVVEAADAASFPATGTAGVIYVALDTGKIFRWGGSAYAEISPSPGSTDVVPEGSTNLYYTEARADGRVAAAVGSSVQAWSATLDSWSGKSVPTGAAVGTNDTQTLTNKTISGATNTLSDIPVSAIGATGTADDTTYLRGDGQWATPEGSGGAETFNQFLLMGA